MTIDEILATLPRPSGRNDLRIAQESYAQVLKVLLVLRQAIHDREPDMSMLQEYRPDDTKAS